MRLSMASSSILRKRNRGAYSNPFSGVGIEFFPLGVAPDQSGLVLHEAGYLTANDWWDFPNTLSPFWRLYYNFTPGHKVVFDHGEFDLTPQHMVLIPDHQLFHSVGKVPVPHCWITFNVSRRLDAHQAIPIRLRPDRTERALLLQFSRCFTDIGTGDREAILHTALALLHLLMIRPEIHWQTHEVPEGLLRALRTIETGFAQPLHLADLARIAGLAASTFSRMFTQWRGVPPHQFLSQVRVREAAHLLANTDRTVDEIADLTGFPDRYYLSRVFKRVIGDSPARFRRRHGHGAR